jgi:hypothetical protein
MVKCSTLFFIYDNLKRKNELFTGENYFGQALKMDLELMKYLGDLEFSPNEKSLRKILEKAL